MPMGSTFANDFAKLLFQATAIANIADNAATSPLTQLFASLHTADPGIGGNQTSNEATYTGYGRVAINRNSGGFTVSANVITNTATVTFGACTAGSNSLTHFAIGTATSGAGKLLYTGALGVITAVYGYTATTADTLTVPGSSLAVDDRVSLYPLQGAANTPGTGLTTGQVYFVKTVSGEQITLAATSGGAAIDVTASGSGFLHKHSVLAVSAGITPNFTAGQLQTTLG